MVTKASDTKKVFDVAKPGKSAPDPNSRPIIVSRGPQVEDPMVSKKPPSDDLPPSAPVVSVSPATAEGKTTPESTAASISSLSSSRRITINPLHDDTPPETVDTGKAEESTAPEDTEEKEPTEPEDKEEAAPETSSAAAVNAVAEQAGAAKKGKNQEDTAQKEATEKLVESRQYFVPIGETRQSRMLERSLIIVLVVLLLGLVGFNLAIDAGLVQTDIRPLFDFIKN